MPYIHLLLLYTINYSWFCVCVIKARLCSYAPTFTYKEGHNIHIHDIQQNQAKNGFPFNDPFKASRSSPKWLGNRILTCCMFYTNIYSLAHNRYWTMNVIIWANKPSIQVFQECQGNQGHPRRWEQGRHTMLLSFTVSLVIKRSLTILLFSFFI